jgi:hypothetical protein
MEIFVQRNGEQTGPLDEAAVRSRLISGELAPTDLAWKEGATAWTPPETFLNGNGASHLPGHEAPPPPSGLSGVEGSQQQKAFAHVQQIIKKGQSAAVVNDLKSTDFKAEVLPFDGHTISLVKSDFTFWAVTLLAIIPLCLVTLSDTQSQLVGLGIAYSVQETGLTVNPGERLRLATYRYLAPEMMNPHFRDMLDYRCDLDTAAMTVFEYGAQLHPLAQNKDDVMRTISRALHQPAQSLANLRPDLTADFCQMIDQMLKKKPALRPAHLNMLINRMEKGL